MIYIDKYLQIKMQFLYADINPPLAELLNPDRPIIKILQLHH